MFDLSVNGKAPEAAWVPSLDAIGSGTTTLTDLTGNGNDGTLVGSPTPSWVVNDGKTMLQFGGGGHALFGLGGVLAATGPQTMSIWFVEQVYTFGFLCGRNGLQASDSSIAIRTLNGEITAVFFSGNFSLNLRHPRTLNTLHHCVTVFDGASFKLFFDGELVGEESTATNVPNVAAATQYTMGRRFNANGQLNGFVGDNRFWSSSLTDADIAELYIRGCEGISTPTPNNLIGRMI